jgi:hypothetical protein
MPYTRSKKALAHELAVSVMRGPANLTPEQKPLYNLWMSTWLLPKMQTLIPQLERMEYQFASSAEQTPVIHGYTDKL